MIPEFPFVVCGWESETGSVTLRDSFNARVARVAGTSEEIAEVLGALGRCRGELRLSEVLEGINREVRQAVIDALDNLSSEGFVIDVRLRARRLLRELSAGVGIDAATASEILDRPGWRPPGVSPALLEVRDGRGTAGGGEVSDGRPALPHRVGSMSLEAPAAPVRPVTDEQVLDLLTAAYGSRGRWKPVPSAGRLWPIVLHVLSPSPHGYTMCWFDADSPRLVTTGGELGPSDVAELFTQKHFGDISVAGRRPIIVISIDLTRIGAKYGNRGALFALLEAGAVSQQIALAATVAQLENRAFGGFHHNRLRPLVSEDLDPVLLVVLAGEAA